jgi:RNA polymerase sigma factor (sigma-70 family)
LNKDIKQKADLLIGLFDGISENFGLGTIKPPKQNKNRFLFKYLSFFKVKPQGIRLHIINSRTLDQIMTKRNQNIIDTVSRYGGRLLQFIRNKVNSKEDAEDVLQEVWYQFSSREETETLESVSGWLYRVAKNKIIDRNRKKQTDFLEDYSFSSDDGTVHFKEILLSGGHTPEEVYLKKLFWEALLEALQELPEKQRQVFEQHELEGITLQEIANRSGENIKTIISRKGYAIKHLRERLNEIYDEFIQF